VRPQPDDAAFLLLIAAAQHHSGAACEGGGIGVEEPDPELAVGRVGIDDLAQRDQSFSSQGVFPELLVFDDFEDHLAVGA